MLHFATSFTPVSPPLKFHLRGRENSQKSSVIRPGGLRDFNAAVIRNVQLKNLAADHGLLEDGSPGGVVGYGLGQNGGARGD